MTITIIKRGTMVPKVMATYGTPVGVELVVMTAAEREETQELFYAPIQHRYDMRHVLRTVVLFSLIPSREVEADTSTGWEVIGPCETYTLM